MLSSKFYKQHLVLISMLPRASIASLFGLVSYLPFAFFMYRFLFAFSLRLLSLAPAKSY